MCFAVVVPAHSALPHGPRGISVIFRYEDGDKLRHPESRWRISYHLGRVERFNQAVLYNVAHGSETPDFWMRFWWRRWDGCAEAEAEAVAIFFRHSCCYIRNFRVLKLEFVLPSVHGSLLYLPGYALNGSARGATLLYSAVSAIVTPWSTCRLHISQDS